MSTRTFDVACLKHLPALKNFACMLTRDSDSAEDLVQESLCRAIIAWPRFTEPNEPEQPEGTVDQATLSWLRRILFNRFVEDYRRRCRWASRLADNVAEVADVTMGSNGNAVDIAAAGLQDEVETALAELEPEFREVVVRFALGGESYKDIVASMGIPIGTVMSRLYRARVKLREKLSAFAETDYRIRAPALEDLCGRRLVLDER